MSLHSTASTFDSLPRPAALVAFVKNNGYIFIDNHLFPAPMNDRIPIHDPVPISDHAPFRQGCSVSQYMDVYVSQSEIHMLQKAGSENMKTRTHISDIDSR